MAFENDVSLTDNDKELIYSYVGGKPKDIKYVVEECKFKNLKKVLDYMLKDAVQKLKYFLEDVEEEDRKFMLRLLIH